MTESQLSKNQQAWLQLNEKHSIIDRVSQNGSIILTANQIREFREPRLLTKVEELASLPAFLRTNGLSILPVSRNEFIVGKFQTFCEIPKCDETVFKTVSDPQLLGLRLGNGSEATSLLKALNSPMLENFLDDGPASLSIMGRQGSGRFEFSISGFKEKISVRDSMIEIDAGIETHSQISLIEAKATPKQSFLIRQLYYPYRTWSAKVGEQKTIRNIFLTVLNDLYTFHEFAFKDPANYSSIELLQSQTYRFESSSVSAEAVKLSSASKRVGLNKSAPFPQADSLDRVISILDLFADNEDSVHKDDVEASEAFTSRQSGYYLNAAKYLGFIVEKGEITSLFELTDLGRQAAYAAPSLRTELVLGQIMQIEAVQNSFKVARKIRLTPSQLKEVAKKELAASISRGEVTNLEVDASTFGRRAGTVASWCNWAVSHVQP
jgi:hypothetical protein